MHQQVRHVAHDDGLVDVQTVLARHRERGG
jgi:hypothetical protein